MAQFLLIFKYSTYNLHKCHLWLLIIFQHSKAIIAAYKKLSQEMSSFILRSHKFHVKGLKSLKYSTSLIFKTIWKKACDLKTSYRQKSVWDFEWNHLKKPYKLDAPQRLLSNLNLSDKMLSQLSNQNSLKVHCFACINPRYL